MSSFCTHIFFSKTFQHICLSLDVNFNESLTNDIVSFEQLGPNVLLFSLRFNIIIHNRLKTTSFETIELSAEKTSLRWVGLH